MKAIILAAGRGSRMNDLTTDQPKCFVHLHGKRLLDWQLSALRGAGINEIAIVRGYRGEMFTEPLTYFDNPRWEQTNMVRTLATARDWLVSGACIVSYADIFYSAETVRRLAACPESLAISYDPAWLVLWQRRFADPLQDAETFRRHPDGTLAEIGQRSDRLDTIEGQYMGLLKVTPEGWRSIEHLLEELGADADQLDMTSLLRLGLARGWRIGTVEVAGPWGEVDSPSDLSVYDQVAYDEPPS